MRLFPLQSLNKSCNNIKVSNIFLEEFRKHKLNGLTAYPYDQYKHSNPISVIIIRAVSRVISNESQQSFVAFNGNTLIYIPLETNHFDLDHTQFSSSVAQCLGQLQKQFST